MDIYVFQIKPNIVIHRSHIIGCIFYDVINTESSVYLQCFKPPGINKIILSSYNVSDPQSFITHLNNFLDSPTPVIQKISTPYVLFQTLSTPFKVQIKTNNYHYSIKVGSEYFQDCVDIIVYKTDSQHQKLAQIYSEPECWEDLVKGNTIEMIKSALQFVNCVFNVHTFELDDNSNIECGVTNMMQNPPRKLSKPFSLSHLYLATKGETWYEHQFAASMLDPEQYDEYKTRRIILTKQIDISFEEFSRHAQLTTEHQSYLSSLYIPQKTWIEFFNSIPKSKHCELNWLPFFIDNYILYDKTKLKERDRRLEIRKEPWVIRLSSQEEGTRVMSRTFLHIVTDPSRYHMIGGGGQRQRRGRKTRKMSNKFKQKTRKNKYVFISFDNNCPSQTL